MIPQPSTSILGDKEGAEAVSEPIGNNDHKNNDRHCGKIRRTM